MYAFAELNSSSHYSVALGNKLLPGTTCWRGSLFDWRLSRFRLPCIWVPYSWLAFTVMAFEVSFDAMSLGPVFVSCVGSHSFWEISTVAVCFGLCSSFVFTVTILEQCLDFILRRCFVLKVVSLSKRCGSRSGLQSEFGAGLFVKLVLLLGRSPTVSASLRKIPPAHHF